MSTGPYRNLSFWADAKTEQVHFLVPDRQRGRKLLTCEIQTAYCVCRCLATHWWIRPKETEESARFPDPQWHGAFFKKILHGVTRQDPSLYRLLDPGNYPSHNMRMWSRSEKWSLLRHGLVLEHNLWFRRCSATTFIQAHFRVLEGGSRERWICCVSVLIQARLYQMILHSVFPVSCSPHGVPVVLTWTLVPQSSQPRNGSSGDPARFLSRGKERRASLKRCNRCKIHRDMEVFQRFTPWSHKGSCPPRPFII